MTYHCDRCGRLCDHDEIHIVSNSWLKKYFSSMAYLNVGLMCPNCINVCEHRKGVNYGY